MQYNVVSPAVIYTQATLNERSRLYVYIYAYETRNHRKRGYQFEREWEKDGKGWRGNMVGVEETEENRELMWLYFTLNFLRKIRTTFKRGLIVFIRQQQKYLSGKN